MVNNRERSVEGGIPRRSLRSPLLPPLPRPGPPGSLGWWGLREDERGRPSRDAAARARVARGAASSLAGRSERPLRALLAGYRARAWAEERSHARQYTALRGRSAGRAGAGLIGRPAAVDPPSYANTSVSDVNNSDGRPVADERRVTRWQLSSDSQRVKMATRCNRASHFSFC
ncbi:uncharacterized protein LOC116632415 [Phoca vitulina]|uniref:uncharacterized protein LOC116632415 n=1 Tax=Phoca vitulina TaxID=9720 RepID=UPI00139627F2|nr:uncharacterized protein LOC116632415 [Phoca vitulina]